MHPLGHVLHAVVNPGHQAKGQPIAGGVDRINHPVQLLGLEGGQMQHRAEDFTLEIFDATDADQAGGDKGADIRRHQLVHQAALGARRLDVIGNALARGFVDHRAAIGRDMPRRADAKHVHRALEHLDEILGDVFLHIKTAQRGTALTGRLKGGFDDRLHRLFGQGG